MLEFENILTWDPKIRDFVHKNLKVEELPVSISRKIKESIDCSTLLALPHAFDIHVHFREPGYTHKEDFNTGSQAAIAGGITAVLDMPNTNPPTLTKKDILDKRALAAEKSVIDVFIAAAITDLNVDSLKEIDTYADAYKVFLGETFGKLAISEEKLHKALTLLEEIESKRTIIFHAESQEILSTYRNAPSHEKQRPPEAEAEGIQKVLELANEFKKLKFHVTHVSSELGKKILELSSLANLTSDTCPRYLVLDENTKLEPCMKKVNPPIRTEIDKMALLDAFSKGIIDIISSDHSPHTLKEKKEQCLSGMPGVQELLPIVITLVKKNELTWERAIEAFHTFPSRILGLKNRTIDEGNYIIVEIGKQFRITEEWIRTKVKWSPYLNWHLYGKTKFVVKDNKIIFIDYEDV